MKENKVKIQDSNVIYLVDKIQKEEKTVESSPGSSSIFLQYWVLQRRDLPLNAKILYGRLARLAIENGTSYVKAHNGYVTRSLTKLSLELSMNMKCVERNMKRLKELDLIRVHEKSNGGINNYELPVHDWMRDDLDELYK